MREASEALQNRWGEVHADALQGLADELRALAVEGGGDMSRDYASAAIHAVEGGCLFRPADDVGRASALAGERSADQQHDLDLER